jgi:rod shape determining protein RodA
LLNTVLDSRLRKNLDVTLIILTFVTIACGIVAIYSASHASPNRFYVKQIMWTVIGAGLMAGTITIDYARFPRIAKPLYFITLGFLLVVLKAGHESHGAQRWIAFGGFQLQPSELAKLAVIIVLGVFLSVRQSSMRSGVTLMMSLGLIMPLFLLILRQPDLGTALAVMAIWFGMVFIAGARPIHLLLVLIAGSLLFTFAWRSGIIKEYQKARLQVFLYPNADTANVGYHVRQSRIAIGSGRITGKGFGQGTQVQGNFIPEKQTDFIFSVVGEEGGFIAGLVVLALYVGILFRGILTMLASEDALARLIVAGVVSLFAFHVIVNLGMTIGIMPVTGVPLPLFSYGGSSLWLNMICIGLILGVGMRRHKLMF